MQHQRRASKHNRIRSLFVKHAPWGKQHRLPFPKPDSKSSRTLELVHMDVCGPFQVTSEGDAKYLATFTDDFSRLSEVLPLKQKSAVAEAVRTTMAKWETQTGNRLKAVRTDRGTEYVNKELTTYFQDSGITHSTTAPYTPEQNGVAERFNRTLVEKVRPMLFDAKLDFSYWAQAAITATYAKSKSPFPVITLHRHRESSSMAASRTSQA